MLTIAKHQIITGMKDAKYLFLSTIILVVFVMNAIVYSDSYNSDLEAWGESVKVTTMGLENNKKNLQYLANYSQKIVKPPSVLAFMADGNKDRVPDTWSVTAFFTRNPEKTLRGNKIMPIPRALDWCFIVGSLMSLLVLIVSYDSICGEKQNGTLRLVMSCSVSRMKLFLGKYTGQLVVILIVFFTGIFLNLCIFIINGILPITSFTTIAIGMAILLSVMFISLILLIGISVSSFVVRPVVSLVLLMIFWIFMVVVIPGIARPITQISRPIEANYVVNKAVQDALQDIRESASLEARTQYRDPFHENVSIRAEFVKNLMKTQQRIEDESTESRIRQAELINSFSSVSPFSLLTTSFEKLGGTGISGYRDLLRNARRYNQQLYSFIVEKDRIDPDSPHIFFSWGRHSDHGVFSIKPVSMNEVPRSHHLWLDGGLPAEQNLPFEALITFLILNLQVAIVAFVALKRYDPR